MNGKKAKSLRKLAGVKEDKSPSTYHPVESTIRNREAKNLLGQVYARYRTATLELNAGSRVLYKMLKKHYKGYTIVAPS